MLKLIACVDSNWGIGRNNDLLFNIKEDKHFFREMTMENPVIMGRKTFESLPHQKPLKGRINVVITSGCKEYPDGVIVLKSPAEAFNRYADNGIVIGGGEIYRQMLHMCDTALITKVHASAGTPDTYMPNLDELPNWQITDVLQKSDGFPSWEILKYTKLK